MESMMYCPNCGTENLQSASVCVKCNSPVVKAYETGSVVKLSCGPFTVLRNSFAFVAFYLIFLIPTYLLPYLGSNSGLSKVLKTESITHTDINPFFWLHVTCLAVLIILAVMRSLLIKDRSWLPILTLLAAVFDITPALNFIPLVPTIFHIATILCGVICGHYLTSFLSLEKLDLLQKRNRTAGWVGFAGVIVITGFLLVQLSTWSDQYQAAKLASTYTADEAQNAIVVDKVKEFNNDLSAMHPAPGQHTEEAVSEPQIKQVTVPAHVSVRILSKPVMSESGDTVSFDSDKGKIVLWVASGLTEANGNQYNDAINDPDHIKPICIAPNEDVGGGVMKLILPLFCGVTL